MDAATRALINVTVYGPIGFYALRGERPPDAFVIVASVYTLLNLFEDVETLRETRAKQVAARSDAGGNQVAGIGARKTRKRSRSSGGNQTAGQTIDGEFTNVTAKR